MINVKKFIESEFETAENLRNELLSVNLVPPELDSIQKWARRNSMPGNWFAAALAIREMRSGTPISVIPYIEGAKLECNPCLSERPTRTGGPRSVFD